MTIGLSAVSSPELTWLLNKCVGFILSPTRSVFISGLVT